MNSLYQTETGSKRSGKERKQEKLSFDSSLQSKCLFRCISICLCLFLFTSSLISETDSKYSGPIARSEKRILDGKLEFEKTGNFPLEWKLYFKGKQGDFVVFYDLNGDEIHFRYRRNKFDLDGEFFVKDLFVGNPYRVKGEWIGYYYYSVDERGKRSSLPTPKKLPGEKKEIIDKQTIPIFQLKEYVEIRTDDLLY